MTEQMTSNKPYLVKAFYDWISDNQLTPYILVDTSVANVLVPMSYVKNNEIVLNVASSAVGSISLGEHAIELSARFGGKLEQIYVPYGAIGAIYAKENGAGTSLPIEHVEPETLTEDFSLAAVESKSEEKTTPQASTKKRPSLKVVK